MQESEWFQILEPALQAQIAVRCHRAYRHDLKNGLQGLYGGFDALNRLLQMPQKDIARVERTNELVKQALLGHEKSLERALHGLAPLERAPEPLDAAALLLELLKFLSNDAAAQRVTLRGPAVGAVMLQARHHKLRLALLSLMVDAIDAMPNGGMLESSAATASGQPVLQLTDTRPSSPASDPWAIDLHATPAYRGWAMFVVRQLILGEAGSIECETTEGGGRRVRIALPAAL